MDLDKEPKEMDNSGIVKQYWEIQRLRENETNTETALEMSKRQMELWEYAKKNGFHKELI